MKIIALVALSALTACSSPAGTPTRFELPPASEPFDPQHARLDDLLGRFVIDDTVDYAGLQAELSALDLYLANLAQLDVDAFEALSRQDRFAFWINAYNASILRLVAEHYPVESIRDLGGDVFGRVWDHRLIPLGHLAPELGEALLSYSDIEHAILRDGFADARVHAVINCASVSCPPLLPDAFVGARLDEDLNAAMERFVRDPKRNELDQAAGRLGLSKIFDWFADDFLRYTDSVPSYLRNFAGPAGGDWMETAEIEYLDYSWLLNDAK